MALFTETERAIVATIGELTWVNPFAAERRALERRALGRAFREETEPWRLHHELGWVNPNVEALSDLADRYVGSAAERLAAGEPASDAELVLYETLALFTLYHHHRSELAAATAEFSSTSPGRGQRRQRYVQYERFADEARRLLNPGGRRLPHDYQPAHVFAFCFQICRAFHHIFDSLVGSSPPIVRLRASIWQSIFTHDLRRYVRLLYDRMSEVSTLVTGPSGTGKELVARAIGLSGYIPFDPDKQTFSESFAELFHPLNLSAMSPTLIESELFGHRRGAFTGALDDREGWFEASHALGTVFLDEIGDIEPGIQVKLLRVLESRTFQRLGDLETRHFHGKVICATHRDLTEEMRRGNFRQDLYYRICSDIIETPSLADQIRARPEELLHLARFVAGRFTGEVAETLGDEVVAWVGEELSDDYAWPGNFRELEQCVRNVLIRGEYRPGGALKPRALDELLAGLRRGSLEAGELLSAYTTWVYARTGSYEGAARRLGLDRRTVKARVDPVLLRRYAQDELSAPPPAGGS